MVSISPHLWFDNNAAEAVAFYRSVFADSEVLSTGVIEGSDDGGLGSCAEVGPAEVQVIDFRIGDVTFSAFNGGPHHEFNDAISLALTCETQAEIDAVWDAFAVDGYVMQCGWIRDKFGVAWQIIPAGLADLLGEDDPEKAKRALAALLGMQKIVLADVEAAMHRS